MGERLSGGNVALALLANSFATGAALVALIIAFASVSGAHLNPAVTLSLARGAGMSRSEVAAYVSAQIVGAFAGVAVAHLMFEQPVFSVSTHARAGAAQALSELVATFGLLGVIQSCSSSRTSMTPYAVGAYISGAYWFTASTSFANPAVTLARAATDTFSGIRPADVPFFVAAQLAAAVGARVLFDWLLVPSRRRSTASLDPIAGGSRDPR
jgi:glycerol uptake facilitator-like aquaporin